MRTGWLNLSNKWYYLNDDGSMMTNKIVDGWYIDQNGIASPINANIS